MDKKTIREIRTSANKLRVALKKFRKTDRYKDESGKVLYKVCKTILDGCDKVVKKHSKGQTCKLLTK